MTRRATPAAGDNDDVLDNARPATLEEATGSALAVRPVALEEPDDDYAFSMGGFTAKPQLESGDFQMPQLKLAQGLTREVQDGDAKSGQWLVPGQEPMDEVTVVPLLEQLGREYRNRSEGGKLNCHSDDRLIGHGDPGGECKDCPFSQWEDDPQPDGSVRHIPPPCQETFRFIVYVEESDSLALVTFKSRAFQVGKKINTFIKTKGLPARFAVKLGASKEKGKMGTYALPTVSYVKADQALLDRARELLG